MKIEIRSNRYPYYEEKEMLPNEFIRLRNEIATDIRSWFKWEDYPAEYRHLIISAEILDPKYGDYVNLYKEGYLMTDDELEYIVKRQWIDIGFVYAIHKLS